MLTEWIAAHPAIFFGGWVLIGYLITLFMTLREGDGEGGAAFAVIIFWPLIAGAAVIFGVFWVFNAPIRMADRHYKRKQREKKERENECQA